MPFGTPVGAKGDQAAASSAATGAFAVTAGSTIIVGVGWTGTATFTSLTDNAGNSYTIIGADIPIDSGGTNHARQYKCENCIGNAALVITLQLSTSTTITVKAVAVPGAAVSSVDQSNAATDAASPFGSGNVTTTQAREMLVSICIGNSGSNPATHAESTGFSVVSATDQTNGTSLWTGVMGTRTVTATGTYAASWTETGGTSAAVFIVSLKEAPGGAFPPRVLPKFKGPIKALPRTKSFASAPAGADVTVAMTGASFTFTPGTLTPNTSLGLAGSLINFSAGTLTPGLSVALTGVLESYAAGSLTPATDVPLAGTLVVFNTGTLSVGADVTVALSGVAMAFAAGTLTPDHQVPLAGQAAAFATGSLSVSISVSLAGSLIACQTGTIGTTGGDVIAAAGSDLLWRRRRRV